MKNHAVTMFKRNIREKLKCDWIRFYYSKDKSHICIRENDFYPEHFSRFPRILDKNNIDYKLQRWNIPWFDNDIISINIPLDQEAFPQRKLKKGAIK